MSTNLITDRDGLSALVRRLEGASCIALDTEFLRVRTYYSKLCLVQIGAAGEFACVDPLAMDDLEPLFGMLAGGSTKLVHAGRQDLELLRECSGRVAAPLFDTQVAAALLGMGEQSGYASLVRDLIGVTLDKAHTRADWSVRPLAPELVAYALDDVRYLEALHDILGERLDKLQRWDWLREEMDTLSALVAVEDDPAEAWRRIGRGAELPADAQWRLRVLAQWRELTARQRDLPREWVLNDATLAAVAERNPASTAELEALEGVPGGFVRRYGEQVLDRLAAVGSDGGLSQPLWPARQPLTSEERERIAALGKWVAKRAGELEIERTLIATRADLTRLVRGDDGGRLMRGWRYDVAGRDLAQLAGASM